MEEIIISIIVAIHGVEDYLRKCLSSLVHQDFSLPYDVICVNDSPCDKSPEIIDEFIQKYPTIFKRLDVNNKNLSFTRNDGLKIAKGEYVCFVDGDDFIYENYLSTLYNLVKKGNFNIGVANFQYIKKGKIVNPVSTYFSLNGVIKKQPAIKSLLGDVRVHAFAWNKIYKRDFLLQNKLLFKSNTECIEDILFNFEAFLLCDKIAFSRKRIYGYVQREQSLIHESPSLKIVDKLLCSAREIRLIANEHLWKETDLKFYFFCKRLLFFYMFNIEKTASPKEKYKEYKKKLKYIKNASIEELKRMN